MFNKTTLALIIGSSLALSGCGGSDKKDLDNSGNASSADMIVSTLINQSTGYINAIKGSQASMTNGNGLEISPVMGVFAYNGFVYVTGSFVNSTIAKYRVKADASLELIKEINTDPGGLSMPSSFIFVNASKAYVLLAETGKLLDINLDDFSIRNTIDLSDYAFDNTLTLHKDGGTDSNPEPSAGVLRGNELFLALAQVNTLAPVQGGFACHGKASVLIIDSATNAIKKHISDGRTCSSGAVSPGSILTLTENGDIYVNNTASFGYHPIKPPGYLRIKAGASEFDASYFFNLKDLDLTADFPNIPAAQAVASYVYNERYHQGNLYMTMFILGLTTEDPNDFIANKNYQPYKLDLVNKTATKLNNPPTNGWSAHVGLYNNQIVFPSATNSGNGLYKANATTPFMLTEGQPLMVIDLD